MSKAGKVSSIRDALRKDNLKMVGIIVIIILFTTVNILLIDLFQFKENDYKVDAERIQNVTISQYEWLDNLMAGINNAGEVTVEMDASKCKLAVWYNDMERPKDAAAVKSLENVFQAHQKMHDAGNQLIELVQAGKGDQQGPIYGEMKAQSAVMMAALSELSTYYSDLAAKCHNNLVACIIWSIVANIIMVPIASILAKKMGDRMSRRISKPIATVADWSHELSMGASTLEFDSSVLENGGLLEINKMIESFRLMAENIQENVSVVRKVADGDMTAFVNIRSASDSLGKNLYRMVQSNDLMFAEISSIAGSVAEGAENISQASASLAESCSVQADAVKDFTESIQETSEFIYANSEKATEAIVVSTEMREEVEHSTRKMEELLKAMGEIREASEKVSDIIRTIDDIAGQTNLLALNAAIEAARAGEAGKGFAVVAGEVKDLANKSAVAAEESKNLIEDTVSKTILGDNISKETANAFTKISGSIRTITGIIETISTNGNVQRDNILKTQDNILSISEAIDCNAASSQEASASSIELSENANALKDAMHKFNLRKREQGKPYIPPEKRNDIDFIKTAEANYQKALREGKMPAAEK